MIHNLSLAPSWLLHFFVCFFYIHFALFCHISGDGIAATKSTIFPLAPSWLLHFSLFCVLKYFFALLCHISEDGLAAKIPNDLQFISLSKFFIAKPILFSSNCFFKNNMYFQIRILTDMQKKVLSAIFFTKIHFHAEMSFNVSHLIHMNDLCAIFRQSTFSRGILMFCS